MDTPDSKRVDLLTEHWYEACEERRLPNDAYRRLRGSLRRFLPSDALSGLGFPESTADAPFVIALTDEAFLRFLAPDSALTLDARALPLKSIVELQVRGSDESSLRASFRVGDWDIVISSGDRLYVRTLAPIGSSFGADNGGETVMLRLAERLGWPTPLREEVAP